MLKSEICPMEGILWRVQSHPPPGFGCFGTGINARLVTILRVPVLSPNGWRAYFEHLLKLSCDTSIMQARGFFASYS
jgi:hypothetical protein